MTSASTATEWWHGYWDEAYEWLLERMRPSHVIRDSVGRIAEALSEHGVAPPAQVLDAPCASGAIAIELARIHGYRVHGVDIEVGTLDIARASLAATGVDGVTFERRDIRLMPDEPTYPAAVNWFTSLGFTTVEDDDVALLAGTRRALTADGVLLIETDCIERWDAFPEHGSYGHAFEDGGFFHAMTHYDADTRIIEEQHRFSTPHGVGARELRMRLYTPDELVKVIERAGFAVIDRELTPGEQGRTPHILIVARATR